MILNLNLIIYNQSLLDNEINLTLNDAMNEFRILKANIDMIKEYNDKLNIYSKNDYLRNSDNM